MPKPNLTDNDDIGFRFNLTGESLRINPVAQINPLKGFRMQPGVGPRLIPKVDGGQKWAKYRRLSNTKRNFSTCIIRSNVDDVFAANNFFKV